MAELVLVRHAATEWTGWRYCGRTDLPLSAAGEAAAKVLGRELAQSLPEVTRIVTSPLLRARGTAAAIAAAMGSATIAVDDRWAETDFGTSEGLTFAELEAAQPRIASSLAGGAVIVDWPGGETASALRARVEAAWHDLTTRAGPTVVVSHGGPLRIAIALATGVNPTEITVPTPGGIWRTRLDRAPSQATTRRGRRPA